MEQSVISIIEKYIGASVQVNTAKVNSEVVQNYVVINKKNEISEIHLQEIKVELDNRFVSVIPPSVTHLSFDECPGSLKLDFSPLTKLNTLRFNSCDLEINKSFLNLKNLKSLNIRFCNLIEIPKILFAIPSLIYLSITESDIDFLEMDTVNETRLEDIDLSGNKLRKLPDEFSQLRKLKSLSIVDNKFTMFPAVVTTLTHLESLNISNNKIRSIPKIIKKNVNLQLLWAYGCSFKNLPDELQQLNKLTSLGLGNNLFSSFPEVLLRLPNLQRLQYCDNHCNTLPPQFEGLVNLNELWLNGNQFKEVPKAVLQLPKLETLYLQKNKITTIPEELLKIKSPIVLSDYFPDKSIAVAENPIVTPPLSVIEKGREEIEKYFLELKEQGEEYIYEAKLILVGEPFAGKTTLTRKILNPDSKLDPQQPMTKGIKVSSWMFPMSKKDFPNRHIPDNFKVNIWDFGGQDIMHSTHRYFLTERSIYILLADNRKEDTDFYYWLYLIELFSGNSVVIIVLNEKYQYKKFVPEYVLNQFPNVLRIQNINLADNSGLDDLLVFLKKQFLKLPHVEIEPLPKKWVLIRNILEKKSETTDYISFSELIDIGKQAGVQNDEQVLRISQFLHDIGTILHFQKDLYLRNIIILKTEWATEAVYMALFDKEIIENGGKFTSSDLIRIWSHSTYTGKHAELLALMKNFELCYQIAETQSYIIPELLAQQPQQYSWNTNKNLFFEYRYKIFMPKGLLTRFMVRLHNNIKSNLIWKNGMVLEFDNSRAEIIERWFERRITVRIEGGNKKGLLDIIRLSFENIHSLFKNLDVDEMIPCNCDECKESSSPHFYTYKKLMNFREKGKNTVECDKSAEDVDLNSLINDVFFQAVNTKKAMYPGQKLGLKKIKVFVASAGSLSDERNKIEICISRLNDSLVETGRYLELKIWEKVSKGFSRTRVQDEFNKLVTGSDIFLCLIYDKLGPFTEEEFNLALNRFSNNQRPFHISIYFKDQAIAPSMLTKEFQNVLDFKEKIKKEEQIYNLYDNIDSLISRIENEMRMFITSERLRYFEN